MDGSPGTPCNLSGRMSFEDEGLRPGAGVGRDYEEGPLSKGNMKCTDTLWLIFFLMFKLGSVRGTRAPCTSARNTVLVFAARAAQPARCDHLTRIYPWCGTVSYWRVPGPDRF